MLISLGYQLLESQLMLRKMKNGNKEERAPIHLITPSDNERWICVPHQRLILPSTDMDGNLGLKNEAHVCEARAFPHYHILYLKMIKQIYSFHEGGYPSSIRSNPRPLYVSHFVASFIKSGQVTKNSKVISHRRIEIT